MATSRRHTVETKDETMIGRTNELTTPNISKKNEKNEGPGSTSWTKESRSNPKHQPVILQHRHSIKSDNNDALAAAKKVTNAAEINEKIWFAKLKARPKLSDDIRHLLLHKCLSINDNTRVAGSNNQSDRK
jgi:hypothetical protein